MGAEADARFIADGDGAAFALGGMNARTRDYARFGLLVTEGGAWNGEQIIPGRWIAESLALTAPPPAPGCRLPAAGCRLPRALSLWPALVGPAERGGRRDRPRHLRPAELPQAGRRGGGRRDLRGPRIHERRRRANLKAASFFRAVAASPR
jgi:CubicO group peptidase (beta-lactamase class C family)